MDPATRLMRDDPLLHGWILVSTVIGIILSIALIAAGIGLIREKAWGRSVSIAYAWLMIVLVVIGSLIMLFAFALPLLQGMDPAASPADTAAVIGGVVGATVGMCFGLIYPILLLIFLNRRAVREFFAVGDGSPLQGAFRIEH